MENKESKMKSAVCAIIVNWNKKEDICRCLDSIMAANSKPAEIVVVDNHSTDGSPEMLRQSYPGIKLIVSVTNLGGAGGFNTGLRYALERKLFQYAWLLDNDVVVDKEALSFLLRTLEREPEIAVAGSLILRMDSPATLQEIGATIDRQSFERIACKRDYALSEITEAMMQVDYVPACSLLTDLNKVREVGLLDEEYFIYFDDVEWCTRFKKFGYRVVAVRDSRVWHQEGGRNRTNNLPVYYAWRNYLRFFRHFLSASSLRDDFITKYIYRAFSALYISRKLGKINSFQTILWALSDAYAGKYGKAPANRSLPLDSIPFGNHFRDDFQNIRILGAELDFYSQFDRFILAQKNPNLRIEYFSPNPDRLLPDIIRQRVAVYPLAEFSQQAPVEIIIVFCRHILTDANPQESVFSNYLNAHDEQVFFMDQHSNLYHGYSCLQQLRHEHCSGLQEALPIFTPLLSDWLSGQ